MTSTTPSDSVVVGASGRMRAVFEFLRVIQDSESTVLISGQWPPVAGRLLDLARGPP